MMVTACLAAFAWYADDKKTLQALLAVLSGLVASRVAVIFVESSVAMMAVWVCVSLLILKQNRYGMAALCAISAAAYFPLWTSYLAADVFGVLMLLTAGVMSGGKLVRNNLDSSALHASSGLSGPVCFHHRSGYSQGDEEKGMKVRADART